MIYSIFRVDKTSGTYSDTLEMFGLARVLHDIMEVQKHRERDTIIHDNGGYYRITCSPGIDDQGLEYFRDHPICPIKAIPTNFYNEEKQPEGIPLVDWDAVSNYLTTVSAGAENPPERPDNLDVLLTINPEAIQGYNGLLFRWWIVREAQPEILQLLLNLYLYSNTPNSREAAIAVWDILSKQHGWKYAAEISGQQLFNPDQGQGQNEPKANRLNASQKPKINFWLTEWLRAVGFYEVAIPRLVGDRKKPGKDKDRKIIVLTPRVLSLSDNSQILNKFQAARLPKTAIRFDILAVLRYLKTLLAYYTEPDQRHRLRSLGRIRHDVVAGFAVAFFKNMGRARSLMNLSFLAFPGWIEIHSEEDARLYIGLLDEMEKLAEQLDESHSDAVTLLQHLRDFVSGDDLSEFLRFTTAYAGFYLAQRERGNNVAPLSFDLVERIVITMGKSYAEIGDANQHPGFHNIARAISESTVIAQWRKTKNNTTYQIRYGLNQELTRKAHNAEQFLEALAEFIHTYNAETARAQELNRKPRRPMVELSDINDVLRLMDQYENARMIAQLLVAYGYTFMKSDQDTNQQESDS